MQSHISWITAALALLFITPGASADEAYLGVRTQELNEALVEALDLEQGAGGVLVNDVVEGSPADEAGLRRGDLITAIGGDAVKTPQELRRVVRALEAGDEIEISILRRTEPQTLHATLGELERRSRRSWSDRGPRRMEFFTDSRPTLGVSLQDMDGDWERYFATDAGALVIDVVEESAAEKAGVQKGDVIVEADGSTIAGVDDLHDALDNFEAGDEFNFVVLRDGERQSLSAELEESSFDRLLLGRNELGFPHGMRGGHRSHGSPQVFRFDSRDRGDEMEDLREQIEELRQQIEELKER